MNNQTASREASDQSREPLPVELLVRDDQRRLQTALGLDQPKPWPSSREEEMRELEHSLQADLAADPIHDHRPRSAPGYKVNHVLRLLDQIDKENSNRRFND